MTSVDLLGAYWTLASGAAPWTEQESCPYDLVRRAQAASRAGFMGMGFWHTDLEHLSRHRSFKEIRKILNDNGITHIEIEFLYDWFLDGERKQKSDVQRTLLLDAAEGLGADHIKVGDFFNETTPMPKLIEHFAEVCALARERGTNVLYEILPAQFCQIHSLDSGLELTRGAGAANGGLMLDIWHMVRNGITNEEIVQKFRPTDLISAELNDGFLAPPEDLHDATVNHRGFVGEGEFDVTGFIAAVQAAGYNGPWGVEVLNSEYRKLPLETVAQRAYDTTMTAFARLPK
jgi:sugar phosphate isomerase/epimerase